MSTETEDAAAPLPQWDGLWRVEWVGGPMDGFREVVRVPAIRCQTRIVGDSPTARCSRLHHYQCGTVEEWDCEGCGVRHRYAPMEYLGEG